RPEGSGCLRAAPEQAAGRAFRLDCRAWKTRKPASAGFFVCAGWWRHESNCAPALLCESALSRVAFDTDFRRGHQFVQPAATSDPLQCSTLIIGEGAAQGQLDAQGVMPLAFTAAVVGNLDGNAGQGYVVLTCIAGHGERFAGAYRGVAIVVWL